MSGNEFLRKLARICKKKRKKYKFRLVRAYFCECTKSKSKKRKKRKAKWKKRSIYVIWWEAPQRSLWSPIQIVHWELKKAGVWYPDELAAKELGLSKKTFGKLRRALHQMPLYNPHLRKRLLKACRLKERRR